MVHLIDFINNFKASLDVNNLATIAYYFVRDKSGLNSINIQNFTEQERVAAKGYILVPINQEDLNLIHKPAYKGVDFASSIFKLVGAHLAAPADLKNRLDQKFF